MQTPMISQPLTELAQTPEPVRANLAVQLPAESAQAARVSNNE
jgi:hypothetical protein